MKEPKLWQKGMILVSVPLLFELIFVVSLDSLLGSAEKEARLAEQSRDIVKEASLVAKLTYDCVNSIYWCARGEDRSWFNKYDLASEQIVQHLKTLVRLVKSRSAAEKHIVADFERAAIQQYKLMSMIKRLIDTGRTFSDSDIAERQGAFSNQLTVMAFQLEKLTESVAPEKYEAREHASRDRVRIGLYIGLLVNIAIGLGLALYFSKGTIAKLRILMDNTRRLSNRQSLSLPIKGDDEIAELDHVFHDMADKLTEAERLKQEFVSMISHDLRSPLTSIKGLLLLLKKGTYGELNQQGINRLSGAEGSVLRLISLISDLLDVDKLESGKFELFKSELSVLELVRKSFDSVDSFAETKKVRLVCKANDERIFADADRIVQVLVNLLSNAIKFSNSDSEVTVECVGRDVTVEIAVCDNGRGIPAQAIDSVFDRFKQVEKADATVKGGSGLGLSICKALVEAHGGTIGVTSREGEGSRFYFRLPATVSQEKETSVKS